MAEAIKQKKRCIPILDEDQSGFDSGFCEEAEGKAFPIRRFPPMASLLNKSSVTVGRPSLDYLSQGTVEGCNLVS